MRHFFNWKQVLTVSRLLSYKNLGEFMTKFLNKKSCYIGKNVKFGKNVIIYENNHIEGNCVIGDNVTLLPNNFIDSCIIEDECLIHNSVIEKSQIGKRCKIGPFARIRPNTIIDEECKIGNFVEVKNSHIGSETKISHLAYVGDAEVGEKCNIGCGVIFANYDGKNKNKIEIGNHVFIGSNCNLIAPLKIDNDSFICAGTTVTENVSKNKFVIGRVKQENKENKKIRYV